MEENKKILNDGALEKVTGGGEEGHWEGNMPGSKCPKCGIGILAAREKGIEQPIRDENLHVCICDNCGNRFCYCWVNDIPICT